MSTHSPAPDPHGRDVRMHRYAAFGGVMESELPFPALRAPVDSVVPSHTWRVRVCSEPAPDVGAQHVGQRTAGIETYMLWRIPHGFRLEYSHAGTFDVDVERGDIIWYPHADENHELARAIVIGPVAALLLEARGDLCLHGSAVLSADGAVAFVGPKHHGKSTLALALTAAGCRLMSDDLVAVSDALPPMVRPAVPTARIWGDAAEALEPELFCDSNTPGIKHTLGGFHPDRVATTVAPLSAVYVLVPVASPGTDARRRRLNGAEAAIALAQQKKLADELIGYGDAASRLTRAVALAAAVPVYELHVRRDLAALPGVIERIMAWHGGTMPTAVAEVAVEQV